ncbi:MAG: class I SAM-dependent methyltransferase [Chlamydiota bacterium]
MPHCEIKKEEKSNWECVSSLIKDQKPMILGKYASYWFFKTPRRMLHSMSYYKFAAKMIGSGKYVLDIGCNEGLGTYLLAKECGFAKGMDFDEEAIAIAQANFKDKKVEFEVGDFLLSPHLGMWDAVTNFDVIEHIFPDHVDAFWKGLVASINPEGIAIIGTPSLISQQYASEVSKKGHVNVYTPERLEEEMRQHFTHVFMFSAHDEIVHTGYPALAHYLIAVGCKKKS